MMPWDRDDIWEAMASDICRGTRHICNDDGLTRDDALRVHGKRKRARKRTNGRNKTEAPYYARGSAASYRARNHEKDLARKRKYYKLHPDVEKARSLRRKLSGKKRENDIKQALREKVMRKFVSGLLCSGCKARWLAQLKEAYANG